jgi:preprotein translocase subunit SecF
MQIDFLRHRFIAYGVSLVLILGSVFLLLTRGLNLGLDFTGGTVVEVRFKENPDIGELRLALKEAGFESFLLQETQDDTFIVKVREGEDISKADAVFKKFGDYTLLRKEKIGGVISSELKQKAIFAVLTALAGILIYISFRFKPLWGAGAILALVHDVLVVIGAYSLTYREVNLEVVSAILVVAGYSVADTVVIFDRIRENLKIRKNLPLKDIMNLSINQTLSRTIMTSLTTFATSFTLFVLGGYALSNIMFAFVVGVVVGTFSSVFVASAFVLDLSNRFSKLSPEPQEAEEGG